jgi:hypothetical protein
MNLECKKWLNYHEEFVDVDLLGCDAVWTCGQIPTFRRNILFPSSGLKSTLRYNPEDQLRHIHCLENLKTRHEEFIAKKMINCNGGFLSRIV